MEAKERWKGRQWRSNLQAMQQRVKQRLRIASSPNAFLVRLQQHNRKSLVAPKPFNALLSTFLSKHFNFAAATVATSNGPHIVYQRQYTESDYTAVFSENSPTVRFLQAVALPLIGNVCHAFMHGFNKMEVYGVEKLLDAVSHRPQGQPLITDCSAGACERNWSAYSLVHTKIRNRLSTSQLEKLVYCRANMKLVRAYHALGTPKQVDPTRVKIVSESTIGAIEEEQIRDEQQEILRLLHREMESVDRRVTRARARAYSIPLCEGPADPQTARRESIRRGKLPIRASTKRSNEAVRLIHVAEMDDLVQDDAVQAMVLVMLEPEYDEEGNLVADGGLISAAESSSSDSEC